MIMDDGGIQKTALHSLHIELGARMVPFAGYEMPLHYRPGLAKEHLHCRSAAGLFDVSHMGQIIVRGADAALELERLLPVDLEGLADNRQVYSLLTNQQGGILDDLIITRRSEDCFSIVLNAAVKGEDIAYLKQQLPAHIGLEVLAQQSLIALQGPQARVVLTELCPLVAGLSFMQSCPAPLLGDDCHVSCAGYTGEDGFEISISNDNAEQLARKLLDAAAVEAIGLGARDSLRLEAGLCLYGHDMDQDTTVVEAGLAWAVNKARRRSGTKAGNFPGAGVVLRQIEQGVDRRRVGIKMEGRVPAREGSIVQDLAGNTVGHVTSGSKTPSLDYPVAMAYVDSGLAAADGQLQVVIRGKSHPATVVKMPFIAQRYYRG